MKGEYGKSEHGNFEVVKDMPVTHAYTVGPKHVTMAAEHHGGILAKEVMDKLPCAHPECRLKYDEHEFGLLVSCKAPLKPDDSKVNPELEAYLVSIKDEVEKNGYVGFAFIRAEDWNKVPV